MVMTKDPASQIVADNIRGILSAQGRTANWLQGRLSKTSSALHDFLSDKRPNASMTIGKLAQIAQELDVPITAFLVPPDRRDAVLGFLHTLHSDESIDPDQAGALVAELLRISKAEGAKASKGGSDRDGEGSDLK